MNMTCGLLKVFFLSILFLYKLTDAEQGSLGSSLFLQIKCDVAPVLQTLHGVPSWEVEGPESLGHPQQIHRAGECLFCGESYEYYRLHLQA